MPIITPAYPSMCATYNITKSSMTIIQREFERGYGITEKIMSGQRPWSDLFVKHTFFTLGYKYYISVVTASTTKEAHKIWSGFVESKVRVLVQGIERHESIALAHAFNKGFERLHICKDEDEIHKVQDGSLAFLAAPKAENVKEEKTEDVVKAKAEDDVKVKLENGAEPPIKTGPEPDTEVYTTTHYIGIELKEGE
jgi:poly(A) polymerase